MRILAMLLSAILAVTVVINLYDKHQPRCRLCEEERIMEAMLLESTSFEQNDE